MPNKTQKNKNLNPYGFGSPQYDHYKEGYPWACGGCGIVRMTNSAEEPEHQCPICNNKDWRYIRKFL